MKFVKSPHASFCKIDNVLGLNRSEVLLEMLPATSPEDSLSKDHLTKVFLYLPLNNILF